MPLQKDIMEDEFVDVAENLAIERATTRIQNMQCTTHSGAQFNGAVYLALLKPGDTTL